MAFDSETFAREKAMHARMRERVAAMADTLSQLDDHEVWTKMTCIEVESIADVLREGGKRDAARAIIEMHALHDEEGDQHYLNRRQVTLNVTWLGNPDVDFSQRIEEVLGPLFVGVEVLSIDTPE